MLCRRNETVMAYCLISPMPVIQNLFSLAEIGFHIIPMLTTCLRLVFRPRFSFTSWRSWIRQMTTSGAHLLHSCNPPARAVRKPSAPLSRSDIQEEEVRKQGKVSVRRERLVQFTKDEPNLSRHVFTEQTSTQWDIWQRVVSVYVRKVRF